MILDSCQVADEYLKPTCYTLSDCLHDLYILPFLFYAHCLGYTMHPYHLQAFKLARSLLSYHLLSLSMLHILISESAALDLPSLSYLPSI
jgi:hypothetical protein